MGGAMTDRDADPSTQRGAKRLRFDRYVLDLDRGCLLLGANTIRGVAITPLAPAATMSAC
jgi:hypothetical protein